MGGGSDQGFLLATVFDPNAVGVALSAEHLAGVAVESGMEAPVGNARVEREMDAFAVREVLDSALGWRGAAVARVVREFVPGFLEGTVVVRHTTRPLCIRSHKPSVRDRSDPPDVLDGDALDPFDAVEGLLDRFGAA